MTANHLPDAEFWLFHWTNFTLSAGVITGEFPASPAGSDYYFTVHSSFRQPVNSRLSHKSEISIYTCQHAVRVTH
ncbi:hypothetical protein GRAQ_03410 [Rahnella aquatilis CIP 78.65 = ATCC 33071]|nr:hypothetical protein GRAQ_03410 [Rahnella aquatilis CIP 78.65 = ATCC 33071]